MNLKHFVRWKVRSEELIVLAKSLKETPCVSIPIDEDVELMLILDEDNIVEYDPITVNTTSEGTYNYFTFSLDTTSK